MNPLEAQGFRKHKGPGHGLFALCDIPAGHKVAECHTACIHVEFGNVEYDPKEDTNEMSKVIAGGVIAANRILARMEIPQFDYDVPWMSLSAGDVVDETCCAIVASPEYSLLWRANARDGTNIHDDAVNCKFHKDVIFDDDNDMRGSCCITARRNIQAGEEIIVKSYNETSDRADHDWNIFRLNLRKYTGALTQLLHCV